MGGLSGETERGTGVGAVVLASSYTALGMVRSLGRRGIPVWVIGHKTSLAAVSRYAKRAIPMKGATPAEHAAFLVALAQEHGLQGWVLFPDSDRGASLIAHHHDELSQVYALTVPPWEISRWALDKRLTYELTEELGIDYPKTYHPESIADVEAIEGTFPMILKPAMHESRDRFSIINGAWRADDREELLALYRTASDAVGGQPLIIIQELVPGGGEAHISYGALCDEGRIVAGVFDRKTRILPVDFGSSSYDETLTPIPQVEEAAIRWFERVKFTGLASIDYKYDARTGSHKFFDVNARAWGWIPLCAYAGLDLPYMAWQLALGLELQPGEAEAGVRWVRTPYDLAAALQLIRRGELTWGGYFESLKGAHHEMYELDDLVPALFEVPILFKIVWNKLRGR